MSARLPCIRSILEGAAVVEGPAGVRALRPLDRLDQWVLMAVLELGPAGEVAVFEDVAAAGEIAYVGPDGPTLRLRTTLETTADAPNPMRFGGHRLDSVLPGRPDVLRRELLAAGEDPDPRAVRALFPPIRRVRYGAGEGPNAFVGTPRSLDVMPLYYEPRAATPRVHPVVAAPGIGAAIDDGIVEQGLVGGWLPVVRTSYPLPSGGRWEQVTFADLQSPDAGPLRVWYRFLRQENDRVAEVRYVESYLPYPEGGDPSPAAFYAALHAVATGWRCELEGMAEAELPDSTLADRARHGIALEMITRHSDSPRYGVVDRAYGAPEHDGFQDILNTSVECMTEWGLFGVARRYLDVYFSRFVRPDGSIDYRGPELGQYGRMLTTVARYVAYSGDAAFMLEQAGKLGAIAGMLLRRRARALELPPSDPSHGLIRGRHEADISFDSATLGEHDYEQPYFSNSAEAWRGLRDLGREWRRIGAELERGDLLDLGAALEREADALRADLLHAIDASWRPAAGRVGLPLFPGAAMLHFEAPYRSRPEAFDENRVWAELLGSGALGAATVRTLLDYVGSVGGSTLGIFGNRSRVVSFMAHETAFGLIQHDLVPELLLLLWAHAFHLHTTGTWMALECVDLDRDRAGHLPYCAPAQLTVPLVVRWMLAFEDPISGEIWLLRAIPRAWLLPGRGIRIERIPTRWGWLSLDLETRPGSIEVTIDPPSRLDADLALRLRLPRGLAVAEIEAIPPVSAKWDGPSESVRLGRLRSPVRLSIGLAGRPEGPVGDPPEPRSAPSGPDLSGLRPGRCPPRRRSP